MYFIHSKLYSVICIINIFIKSMLYSRYNYYMLKISVQHSYFIRQSDCFCGVF